MWYVIILALSACGNCWAMDEVIKVDMSRKDIQRVSQNGEISDYDIMGISDLKDREKCIYEDGRVSINDADAQSWNTYDRGSSAVRHYHLKMAQYYQTLRGACDPDEEKTVHAEYSEKKETHAALLKYLHGQPKITFSKETIRKDSSAWVYAAESSLVSIKSDTLEDPRVLSLRNQAGTFTAYSLENSHVCAADNECKVYNWDTYNGWQGTSCQLPETCKEVTAMQQVNSQHAVAIFFKDQNGNKKAGFLLRKNGYGYTFSVVPSEKSIDAITWRYDNEKECGSILSYNDHLYKVVAKYIIRGWDYPDVHQYVEYIMPNPNDSKAAL